MSERLTRSAWTREDAKDPNHLLTREWLVTNGLGGYASGTIAGINTRRYHGLLVASLASPHGRTLLLNHLAEEVRLPDGSVLALTPEENPDGSFDFRDAGRLQEFRLEMGLPLWRYEIQDCVLEKRLLMPYMANTVIVLYRLLCGKGTVRLRLRPSMHFRTHGGKVDTPIEGHYTVSSVGERYEVRSPQYERPLRILAHGQRASFVLDGGRFREMRYSVEAARGYDSRGTLWSPGYIRADLTARGSAALIASTQPWEDITAFPPEKALEVELQRRHRLLDKAPVAARTGVAAELVLAADQFIIQPNTRRIDQARANAEGDQARTIIAGYPWFTDWGRDTMISLEGLTLVTGRHAEAGYILRTFLHYVRDGLIPNHFPEGSEEAIYNTADASLWYFHALDRYLAATGDRLTLRMLLPTLQEIVDRHRAGTRFGIGMDHADGLLRQGMDGFALTWMDAKVDDWVVTPRRGKTVEINALWYNALRLLDRWAEEELGDGRGASYRELADRVRESFNKRYWFEEGGYLADIVDGERGDDLALRPNQIFSISLPHPVLDPARWESVLETCRRELLSPV
ncbi:MAG TPA: amylo-alpha-1,6-glucosidase, partial [Planctomycetota bacterium]|nr:amylo-alpha-1,6-glucosidase [Planctomycetota bacterium]